MRDLPACQRGRPAYCENDLACHFAAARLDGSSSLRGRGGIVRSHFFGQSSFASHCLACERNVVKVRDDVPLELLGPLGCGIQAGAGAVLNAAGHPYRRSIAVFGTGSVGLSAVLAAAAAGYPTIIGTDTNPARLKLASELGATHVINAAAADPAAEVRAITGDGAGYAIEATGRADAVRQAVDCLAQLGRGAACRSAIPALSGGQARYLAASFRPRRLAPGRAPQPPGVEVGSEDALQHVPVLRMSPDSRLEQARDLLHHRRFLLAVSSGRHRDLRRARDVVVLTTKAADRQLRVWPDLPASSCPIPCLAVRHRSTALLAAGGGLGSRRGASGRPG